MQSEVPGKGPGSSSPRGKVDLSPGTRVRTGMSGSCRFCSSKALSSAGASKASLSSRTTGAATSATGRSNTACGSEP